MGLTRKQIEEFKAELEALRKQLMHVVQGTSEEVRSSEDRKGHSQHQADEGTDDFLRNISIEVSSKEIDIIQQVDRALEKIAEGNYGVCDISGEEISMQRLKAVPYATMTVSAQEKLEKGTL